MSTWISRALLVSALAVAAAGCNSNSSSPTTTTPTPSGTTETFTGTLTTNGAVTHTFTAAAAGQVTATLTALTSDATLKVSLALGTFNGATCQIILANDNAQQGTIVTGNVSTTSNLCVRIADANGSVPAPTPYTITVAHP